MAGTRTVAGTRTARRRSRAGLAAAVAVLALAGCGNQQAGGGDVTSTPSATPSGPSEEGPAGAATPVPGGSSLTVVLDDGSGARTTWTLTCAADGAPGGDHPDAANACAALMAAERPFAPVPKGMACTMVYGGPQSATVQGRWNGEDVLATFQRTDGCEIARWDRIAPLLRPGAPAGSSRGPA